MTTKYLADTRNILACFLFGQYFSWQFKEFETCPKIRGKRAYALLSPSGDLEEFSTYK